ncbi:MAG TPA: nucleotidyltransferase family protein [Steroidobacteraceae bacterium]|jgi:dTDP-glucose pyrophosphorylase|nr:nucleotidyltransferase family protein [Steroidobacteraceae bacterium]
MMTDWRQFCVTPDAPLIDALLAIDRGALGFALVVDHGKLVGLATDGDVRRALIRGVTTSAPIRLAMNDRPVVGRASERPAEWRRKLHERRIRHLPIVDETGQLLRVVNTGSCSQPRDNWAVVMAGGLGTRLRPITEQLPKPMIEIGGTPILETILRTLTSCGITRVFFAVNYRADMIVDYFGDGDRWDAHIEYLREPKRMGTAGGLSLLPQVPLDPLLVMNGDILTGLDYGEMLDKHSGSGAAATVCVREHATQIPYGVVDANGVDLLAITEKPVVTHLTSAGVYALSAETLRGLPTGGPLDMPALVQSLVEHGRRVRVHRIDEYWIDIGRIDDLERARRDFGKPGDE